VRRPGPASPDVLVGQMRTLRAAEPPIRDTGLSSGLEAQESSGVSRLFVMFGFDALPHLRVLIATLQHLAALLGLRQPFALQPRLKSTLAAPLVEMPQRLRYCESTELPRQAGQPADGMRMVFETRPKHHRTLLRDSTYFSTSRDP
jgi:hypothetical protein